MVIMKTHIEVERMPGKLCAQGIGRGPGNVFTKIGHTDRNDLLNQSDTDKRQSSDGKSLQSLPCQGRIDKFPHDLRSKYTQANTAQQHNCQQDKPSLLWAD